MQLYNVINTNTGKELKDVSLSCSLNFTTFNLDSTYKGIDGTLYYIKSYGSNSAEGLIIQGERIPNWHDESLYTIAIKFPNNLKEYHYFVPKCKKFGKDENLIIETPFGNQKVQVANPRVSDEESHAAKLLKIVTPATPKQLKPVVKVRYIDNKSVSRYYYYRVKGDIPKVNRLYWFEKNNALVVTCEIIENIDGCYNEKTFYDPTDFDITSQFNKPCCETSYVLSNICKDNLSSTAKEYLSTLCNTITVSNDGLSVSDALNNWATSATTATNVINTFTNAIATIDSNIYNTKQENKTINSNIYNKKENDTMNINKMFKNFEFGKINTNVIKFSINGLAFLQADGSYATYSAEKHEFTDVSAFVMDTDFIFAMPVAIKDLKKGDIVKHLNKYVIIEGIFEEDGTIKAIDPLAGEEKVIIPIKNMFGFNYYTKIMNIFDGMNMTPNAENPFGNFLPFLMMRDGGFDDTMMLAMMMQNGNNSADFMSNPFMMMALLKK